MRPCSATASSEAISIADDASQICEATAAVIRPPSASGLQPGHLLQRRVARALVGVEARRRGTISCLNRPSSMAVRARVCEARANSSISLAADVPLLGDHLRAAELGDLLVAVPLQPAGRLGERRGEAVLLGDQHRRRDRDGGHVLQSAGDDEVLGAGHDALGGEVHGLLRRAALPVDGHARDVVGQAGHQPRRPRDVAGLRADRVAAAHHHVVDRARVDAGALDQRGQHVRAEVRGVHCASEPPRLPTGVRTASTM